MLQPQDNYSKFLKYPRQFFQYTHTNTHLEKSSFPTTKRHKPIDIRSNFMLLEVVGRTNMNGHIRSCVNRCGDFSRKDITRR